VQFMSETCALVLFEFRLAFDAQYWAEQLIRDPLLGLLRPFVGREVSVGGCHI